MTEIPNQFLEHNPITDVTLYPQFTNRKTEIPNQFSGADFLSTVVYQILFTNGIMIYLKHNIILEQVGTMAEETKIPYELFSAEWLQLRRSPHLG